MTSIFYNRPLPQQGLHRHLGFGNNGDEWPTQPTHRASIHSRCVSHPVLNVKSDFEIIQHLRQSQGEDGATLERLAMELGLDISHWESDGLYQALLDRLQQLIDQAEVVYGPEKVIWLEEFDPDKSHEALIINRYKASN